MDDPMGLGLPSPSKQRLHERFHRKASAPRGTAPKGTAPKNPAPRLLASQNSHVARAAAKLIARPAPPPSPAKQTSSAKTGTVIGAVGCFAVLAIIGGLVAVGSFFVPMIWRAIEQGIVHETGKEAFGKIISAERTNTQVNEETIFRLSVEVHVPGYDPYTVDLEQGLSDAQIPLATPGTWTSLRYDPDEMRKIVIVSVGVADPTLGQPNSGAMQDLVVDPQNAAPVPTPIPEPSTDDPLAPGIGPNDSPRDTKTPSATPPRDPEPIAPQPEDRTPEEPQVEAAPTPVPAAPSLSCVQARSCCQTVGGSSCMSFTAPGFDSKACRKALRNFAAQAKAAGNSCAGAP